MRTWLVALAGCLVVAVGVPTAWWLTRPAADAGVPVASVGGPSGTPSASGSSRAGLAGTTSPSSVGGLPVVTARPAVPDPVASLPAPVRLRIPSAQIDARVLPVGVQGNGFMVVPEDTGVVGWYRFSAEPGAAQGSAVIAGHVDSRQQGAGAMFRLRDVGVGDLISVTTAGGAQLGYRVVGRQTIVKRRLPTERLFALDGSPRLVLITCGGPFDPALASYQDNVVVVAVPATTTASP